MKVILMICNSGHSERHFLKSLASTAELEGYKVALDFGGILYDKKIIEKYENMDYLFLFAPATEMTNEAMDSSYLKIDIILLTPQVRYMLPAIRELSLGTEVKCIAIEPVTFAELAVKECFNLIKSF
ncbi:PTS sugar transporter subunit IIB [Fusibacter bizertensis]